MAFAFLKKFFGAHKGPSSSRSRAKTGQPDLEGFVEFVVHSLVDNPNNVTVKTIAGDHHTTIQVTCDKPDIGKIIGKSGKTIAAIRALTNGAAGRIGKRVNVEILD